MEILKYLSMSNELKWWVPPAEYENVRCIWRLSKSKNEYYVEISSQISLTEAWLHQKVDQ